MIELRPQYSYIHVFEFDLYKAVRYEFKGSWLIMYDVVECEEIEHDGGGIEILETDLTHSVLGIHANTMVRIQHITVLDEEDGD